MPGRAESTESLGWLSEEQRTAEDQGSQEERGIRKTGKGAGAGERV